MSIISLIVSVIALLIAITIHEFAHALAADKLGDPTPRLMGRLTLNPLAHLDPIGTLMLLVARFGWGKPVQFDPFNLQNPRRDAAIISLAGPVSNLILATLLAIAARFIPTPFNALLIPIITINVALAIFNLIPIHPLDGFQIVGGFIGEEHVREWESLKPYGLYILLFLLLPLGPNGSLIRPILNTPLDFILGLLLG